MAYNIPLNSIIELRDGQQMNGQVMMNVYHYIVTATTGTPNDGANLLQDLLSQVSAAGGFMRELALTQASTCTHQDTQAQMIGPSRFRAEKINPALIGGLGGTPGVQNVMASGEFFAQEASRHGVGRKEIGGLTASVVVGGVASAGLKASLASYATKALQAYTLTDGANTIDIFPIILRRDAPTSSLKIVGAVVKDTIRTASRRTVGRGI